jgi:predicted DCC family thiol-disulfide oxidoreductase YuxK
MLRSVTTTSKNPTTGRLCVSGPTSPPRSTTEALGTDTEGIFKRAVQSNRMADDPRASRSVDASPDPDGPVVLFDGVCNLCNGLVGFLIPRDPEKRLRFAPLQSEAGRALLSQHGFPTDDLDTVVLVEGDRAYTKSDAAIRIGELLGWPYRLACLGRFCPTAVRDRLYDAVADRRYDWFGRRDRCLVPDDDVADRFLP